MDEIYLRLGEVYEAISPDIALEGIFRLLEIQAKLDMATVIGIPVPRSQEPGKQKNYYAKGFERVRISHLKFWLESGAIKHATLDFPPYWLMDDDSLNLRLRRPSSNGTDDIAPALRTRNVKWELIEPIVPAPQGTGTLPPNLSCLDGLVKARARDAGVSDGQVYDALHRFYAFGCQINALIPNRIGRCGNPGKKRLGKNGVKLGRKNAAAKLGDIEHQGLILTETDIQNIQDAYQLIGSGVSPYDAYTRLNAMFYSTGYTLKHGVPVPILLPAYCRPTYDEFIYRGAQGCDVAGAMRRIIGEGEWLRNYRPLIGSSRDGITAIAQTGSVDASPIDVHLVSCCNPNLSIGVARAVFVRDIYSGLFLGWSLSIGNPTAEDAKLAILRAAESKATQLKKYELELPEEDFPSLFFIRYLSDNGELRCKDALTSIVGELESGIEFIPSYRADLNSVSETGHQIRHKKLDHKLPGTTKGRQRKRGERAPIESALLSRFTYTRLLLHWIHWYNTKKPVPLSEIPSEMRRDFGKRGEPLPKNRIGIFRWAQQNGYVLGRPLPLDSARAHLLPRFMATLRRDGLTLHRPGKGPNVELLHGARFASTYLAESGLLRSAISRKAIHIQVRADPEDLSAVYIIDDKGIHRIPNVKSDPILLHEGTISDLCSMNDEERTSKIYEATQRGQDEAELNAFREETVAQETKYKNTFKDVPLPERRSKTGVRQAQALEKKLYLDQAAQDWDLKGETGNPIEDMPPRTTPAPRASLSRLEQARLGRLTSFLRTKE